MDDIQKQLYSTFGSKTPIVVAGVVGVFSLAILWCLLGLFGGEKKERKRDGERRESENAKDKEEKEEGDDKAARKPPKGKGAKVNKQSSKKVTLPSHPLLAGEFKGHTGAVLSIDMESNGKYIASCSEGIQFLHCQRI